MGGTDRAEREAALRAELEALERVTAAWAAWADHPSPDALAELGEALKAYQAAVEAARKDT